MSKVILDPVLRARLNGLKEQLEFCDEGGKTLGHYVPAEMFQKLQYALAESQRPCRSPEEIERRRNEIGGRSLAEIWDRLGQS